jgi:hypothetical protein
MKYLKLYEDFSKNEGLFDFFKKKEEPSGFGLDVDKSQDDQLKEKTQSQINISYETSYDASFVVNISGDLITQNKGSYIITPRKIKVYATYLHGAYGGTINNKPIDFHSLSIYNRATDQYVKKGNAGSFKDVDSLYDSFNRTMQSYIGKDLKLSFYKLDLKAWAEEHSDPHFILGKKTPTWVKDNLKLPFIEDGEIPETNFIEGNKLKEAIWVSIPEMSFAMAMPGNGILRKISVSSTELW